MKDFEPCGGDGVSEGGYGRAILLASLEKFFKDPLNLRNVQTAMLSAPSEDQAFLEEVVENLSAGIDPRDEAIDAVVDYARIFCGVTFRAHKVVEDDTGFVGDEPWE